MAVRQLSASNLTDLIRKESSVTVPGLAKSSMTSAERRVDWQDIVNQVTTLFQTKKMTMKLQDLIDKVKSVKAEVGNIIIDFYQESILKKGMIILREEVREKSGEYLDKLATCWTVFFCNILPTLQAIFASLPQANGLCVRDISLVYFRDIVVLKTKLDEAIEAGLEIPPRIVQMLLVLQSVHDSNTENYQRLERLVAKTVVPYLRTSGLKDSPSTPVVINTPSNESAEQTIRVQTPGSERLDPVLEVDTSRCSQGYPSGLFASNMFTLGSASSRSDSSALDEYQA